MIYKYDTIFLDDIATTDEFYKITTQTETGDIRKSLQEVGLLHPPWVIPCKEKYIVVSGFRRIAACKKLGWSEISAGVIDPASEEATLAKVAIADNTCQRSLNIIEQMRALTLLNRYYKEPNRLQPICKNIGIPDNSALIKKILRLSKLPAEIHAHLLSNVLSLTMALMLFDIDPGTMCLFADLFQDLKVGLNKQKEIITNAYEIARREDISLGELMDEPELQDILSHDKLERSQKLGMLRTTLRKRRYPSLSKREEQYKQQLEEMKLDPIMTLSPPKFFEGTTYTLNMQLTGFDDLSKCCDEMDRLAKSPALRNIFSH